MFINPNDLLPTQPNMGLKPKLTLYRIFKNFLLSFVVLGGVYMVVDKVTDHLIHNNERNVLYKECDDSADVFGHKKFSENILNAEHIEARINFDENTMNLLKNDMVNLRNQVMALWNSINEEPNKCHLPEIDNKIETVIMESNTVDTKIKKALDTYDADKLALYDYAAEYAGGEVVSTPGTTPYPTTKILRIFGWFKLFYSSLPNEIIKPSTMPGNCFKFYGSKARIVIKLGKNIHIGSVSMEHSPLVEDYSDAPKDFKVHGLNDVTTTTKTLLGSFTYDTAGESIQNFPLSYLKFSNRMFEYVELEILSNHGNPSYTSIYRFRVHAGKSEN